MSKDIIKKAFADAEKERQEQEVSKIKSIVKAHLEKIETKSKEHKKLGEEISLLKKDLDDMKAGRLDRIEERHEVDERAKEVRIIIVKKVEHEYIPMQPWRSPWTIEWATSPYFYPGSGTLTTYASPSVTLTNTGSSLTYLTSGTAAVNTNAVYCSTTGNNVANFVSGTYDLSDGKIITL